jgi:hypothetical protein
MTTVFLLLQFILVLSWVAYSVFPNRLGLRYPATLFVCLGFLSSSYAVVALFLGILASLVVENAKLGGVDDFIRVLEVTSNIKLRTWTSGSIDSFF